MTLDVVINLRASVWYSLCRMVREHNYSNYYSKLITAEVPWRKQGSVHKYACHTLARTKYLQTKGS